MGNALQDQLLKAGLVDKKKANKAHKAKRQQEKQARKGQSVEVDQAKVDARQEKAKNVERDRELNRQRQKDAEVKAVNAQIKQLIEMNRLDEWQGDLAYSFTDNNKVRRLHVEESIQRQLSRGLLAIAQLDGRYEPIPAVVAEKIAIRDPGRVIINSEPEPSDDEDDPYAEFKVPDDLMW